MSTKVMQRLSGCLAGALLLLSAHASADAPGEQAGEGVAAYVGEWRAANHVPGAAVAVIDSGDVSVHLSGRDGDGEEVTTKTPFLIGSVAKTLTAATVLRLVDQDELALDDEVADRLRSVDGLAGVTVRELLTHTAGYTAADGLAVSERYDNAQGALTAAAEDLSRNGTEGKYAYSSANYLMLGALVEEVTDTAYGKHLESTLLRPLGMTSTTATVEGAAPLPPGHRLWWGHPRQYDPGFDSSGAPYGYVVSTLDDLVTYAEAMLDSEVLPTSLEADAMTAQVETGPGSGYGFGWRIDETSGARRVHHSGATPGYFAHVLLTPREDRAVVVLANAYSEARAPSLAAAARDLDGIASGGSAEVSGGDPLLGAAPWMMLVPACAGLAALIIAFRRPRSRGRRRVAAVAALAVAGAVVLLPLLLGMPPRTLRTWAPDLALAAVLAILTWAGAALVLALTATGRTARN